MFLNKSSVVALCAVLFVGSAHAEPLKVSLLLGDTHSKAAVEAVKMLNQDRTIRHKVSFQIYPTTDITAYDLRHLKASKLVLMHQWGPKLSQSVGEEFRDVLKKGGRIYAIGTYTEEDKQIGIVVDEKLKAYFRAGGVDNIRNGLLYALNGWGWTLSYAEPAEPPKAGIYDRRTRKIFSAFEDYQRDYAAFQRDRPWIGIVCFRDDAVTGNSKHLDALILKLEQNGFNVLPIFGVPDTGPITQYFFDEHGRNRVKVVVAISMKFATDPSVYIPLLTKLNVPVINAITLYTQSREAWEQSKIGLDIIDRAWQVATTELAGEIQPTVFASKEQVKDPATGMTYVETTPIPQRLERLVQRVKAWVNLQDKPNKDKIVTVMYWNSPPGQERIGAWYLSVLPESLWQIYHRLEQEGYNVGESPVTKEDLFADITCCARNIGNYDQQAIDRLAESGRAALIPLETYRSWFKQIPEQSRAWVLDDWGPPEQSKIMLWRDREGKSYLVIPFVRYGNIIFSPQPERGWAQDPEKMYHSITLAPHHQYIAWYLWLKQMIAVDAVVSVGVHGSHEWLPGKEVGFTDNDFSEWLLKETPNIYPYSVDNLGEGTQAKRRGMAVMIDHMTPPFDKPGLNPEMKELASLLGQYELALEKSPPLAQAKLAEINTLAKRIGVFKDLGIDAMTMPSEDHHDESGEEAHEEEPVLNKLEHYIEEVSEKLTPFGLHTFGVAPDEPHRRKTAEAIMSIETSLPDDERERRTQEMEERILLSAKNELDALVAGLSGRYVPGGPGGDPIRNPDSLPTGRNFYSFDPRTTPAKGTYEMGAKLANELIDGYKKRHGEYPDKLSFTLWDVETMRHEGIQESQIMYLMGIRPKWNERGSVVGVEAIPREELGRPRIDVAIVTSGSYRDLFSVLMDLLDQAVTLAKQQTEDDNILRRNVARTKAGLVAKGIADDVAERLATVRIFAPPTGAYGTNLQEVIPQSYSWEAEQQVADVYFMRLSHLFGQGFWSEKMEKNGEDVSLAMFKSALSGAKMVVHSQSSNLLTTLDNDDVYQYVGGTAMAIRTLDGNTPDVYLTNTSNPKKPLQEPIERIIGREMRSRYLNPTWIKEMTAEGYAGARFLSLVFENLWGMEVTMPEVVDDAKWHEMYETYILDKYQLDIANQFRKANNLWAYEELTAKMLEAIRKGYWKPEQEVIDTLSRVAQSTIVELGIECSAAKCGNPELTKLASAGLVPGATSPADGTAKASVDTRVQQMAMQSANPKAWKRAPGQKTPESGNEMDVIIKGFEMQDISQIGQNPLRVHVAYVIGFLLLIVGLIVYGFVIKRSPRHVS